MKEVYSRDLLSKNLTGIKDFWYCFHNQEQKKHGSDEIDSKRYTGIRAEEIKIVDAIALLKENGAEIGTKIYNNVSWTMFPMGDYSTEAYLFNSCFVAINELKLDNTLKLTSGNGFLGNKEINIDRIKEDIKRLNDSNLSKLKDFPKYGIAILSNTKEGLTETASKLNLPLEHLVKA